MVAPLVSSLVGLASNYSGGDRTNPFAITSTRPNDTYTCEGPEVELICNVDPIFLVAMLLDSAFRNISSPSGCLSLSPIVSSHSSGLMTMKITSNRRHHEMDAFLGKMGDMGGLFLTNSGKSRVVGQSRVCGSQVRWAADWVGSFWKARNLGQEYVYVSTKYSKSNARTDSRQDRA